MEERFKSGVCVDIILTKEINNKKQIQEFIGSLNISTIEELNMENQN